MYNSAEYDKKTFSIKWLKNSRKINYEFNGNTLVVIAFGCFDFESAAPRTMEKINTIIEGFENHHIKHILSFEPNKNFLARNDKFHFKADNVSNESDKIFYDDFCVTKNYHTFTLQQFYYLLNSALKASGQYALGLHCQAGTGRTGAAVLALKIFSMYLNNNNFFEMDHESIYAHAWHSFSEKEQAVIDLTQEQQQSLYALIGELQLMKNKEDIKMLLEGRLQGQQDERRDLHTVAKNVEPISLPITEAGSSRQLPELSWGRRVLGAFCGCFFSGHAPITPSEKERSTTVKTTTLTSYNHRK